jgi:hypothetical protein
MRSTPFRSVFLRFRRAPRKPRHPLLRVLFGLLGLVVLALMVVFGVFIGLAMLAAGALLRLWVLKRKAPTRRDDPLQGDFRVVAKPALPAR